MAGEVSYKKSTLSDFYDYRVADLLVVLFQIHPQRLVPNGMASARKTILPSLVETAVKPHSHESLL